MGSRTKSLLLHLRIAMVLLDDLIGTHVLIGGASYLRRVLNVLGSLAIDRVARHDLLHGLELFHVTGRLLWWQIVAGLAVPSIVVHDKGCLAPFRAHRHIRSLLVQV